MNFSLTIGLIFGFLLILIAIAGAIVLIVQFQKLLRQIRKLAALYPPYPVFEKEGKAKDMSEVQINEKWDDEGIGRD